MFRALGVDVTPWPADYRASGKVRLGFDFTQPTLNSQLTSTAVREWLALVGARFSGRTESLLP
jgi:uncharacterized SAM-binding protein YcdF (DUF218 family)